MLDLLMLIISLTSLVIQILEYRKNNSRATNTVVVILIKID